MPGPRQIARPSWPSHTVREDRLEKTLPTWPFIILVAVAVWAIVDGAQGGRWPIVTGNAVALAVAIWGIRLTRKQTRHGHRPFSTGQPIGQPQHSRPDTPTAEVGLPAYSPPLSQDVPMTVAAPPAPDPQEQPVVDSFTVTAQIRSKITGTTACLIISAPEDVEIPRTAMILALLTLGQRVLEDHRLTDRVLPEVEATTVQQAATTPVSALSAGFIIVVTNDLIARHSTISLDTKLPADTEEGTLLIAATLFAGAEHLLEPS